MKEENKNVGKDTQTRLSQRRPRTVSTSEFEQVVEKYKLLIDTPRDDDGKLIEKDFQERMDALFDKSSLVHREGHGVIEKDFQERMDALFDKSFVNHCEGDEDMNFCALSREMMKFTNLPNLEFKIFRYKQVGDGIMKYYLRYATGEETFVFEGHCYYKNAMIYKSYVTRSLYKKVSGQHTAVKDAQLTRTTTEREFGCHIHELPSMMHDQLLGKDSQMLPIGEKFEMLRIHMVYKVDTDTTKWNFLFWRDEQELRLVDSVGKPYVDGAYFRFVKRAFGTRRITLYDGKHEAVAFCEKQLDESFTIHGRTPLVEEGEGVDQNYATTPTMEDVGTDQRNVVPFYLWFRVKWSLTISGPLIFVEVMTYDVGLESNDLSTRRKAGFEPLYKVMMDNESNKVHKTINICDYYDSKDHMGVIKTDTNSSSHHLRFRHDHQESNTTRMVEVDVAPGVDPALILCIAACWEAKHM